MPFVNPDSLFAEYPFLEDFRDKQIQILRYVLSDLDQALLNSYSGELFSEFNSNRNFVLRERLFYLLEKDGTIVTLVGYPVPQPRFNLLDPRTWFQIKCTKESVADAFSRIGEEIYKVQYVLIMSCQEMQLAKVPATFANAGEWYQSIRALA